MFAAGRILRNNRRLSAIPPGGLLAPPKVREKERRKFRCYVPFMWSALVMSCIGLIIILAGIAMCFFGYYFGPFAVVIIAKEHSDPLLGSNNWTSMVVPVVPSSTNSPSVTIAPAAAVNLDQSSLPTYRGLIYAGPVVMSFGCFAIVFACVIVCETRDRALETMDDRVRQGLSELPSGGLRPDFYALVVEHKLMRIEKQRRRRRLRHDDGTANDDNEQHFRPHSHGQTSGTGCERTSNFDVNCLTADGGPSPTPVINIYVHDDYENSREVAAETSEARCFDAEKYTGFLAASDRDWEKNSDRVELVHR